MTQLVAEFRSAFQTLHTRSMALLTTLDDEILYRRPRTTDRTMSPFSCGEYLLRSAAKVEQTFGGITTRLWDDPFEWTLPEKLSTKESILQYFDEVAATTDRGLAFLATDDDLAKIIPAPEKLVSIASLLIDTLTIASHYQGRAYAIFQTLSDKPSPRL